MLTSWKEVLVSFASLVERYLLGHAFLFVYNSSSRAKMEMATTEQHTPLKQDTKKGELRYFKYGDIPFNYGWYARDPSISLSLCLSVLSFFAYFVFLSCLSFI